MTDDGKMTNVQYRMSNVKVKELRRNNVEKTRDRRREKRAFTIVELLTVMSIIVILISILVPALNKVRRYALDVKERAQLHAIGTGLETFSAEFDGYPDSNESDDLGAPYCGAMKLAEAMVGQDLKGFNPDSRFEKRGFPWFGTDPAANRYDGMPYPHTGYYGMAPDAARYDENIKKRKMYLQLENANATQIRDIWSAADIPTYAVALSTNGSFEPNSFVLCDVYRTHTNSTGKKTGMPILYYKADPTKTRHPADNMTYNAFLTDITNNGDTIYDVRDNLDFVDFPLPWELGKLQPMANLMAASPGGAMIFYQKIRNKKVSSPWPYRADTFILMSAGYDGLYGTGDDIFNFGE